jgi:hypothetical protein
MGVVNHPHFTLPDNRNAHIWRYMDLSKFLSIIDKSSLYFSQLTRLGKDDHFEGYLTNANLKVDDLTFDQIPTEWKTTGGINDEETFNIWKANQAGIREFLKKERDDIYVNSWHLRDYEYAAMWNQYARNDIGIAIQSTVDRLVNSLNKCSDIDIFVGLIKYLDYNREAIPMKNLLLPFIHKRKSFEYEQEIRALIWKTAKNYPKGEIQVSTDLSGFYIPVDVEILIENIFVSPNSSKWQYELLESITHKLGINRKILYSDISSNPLY